MMASLLQACDPATFAPSVFGAEILSITASLVANYSAFISESYRNVSPSVELQNASFCNVTVAYIHPGQDGNITVEAWLPIDSWNGRLQAIGGGGWVAGRYSQSYNGMLGALADEFATITTDAGLGGATDASPWALLSPGNVNLYNLQNLASVSLNDEAIIGKSLVRSFYGRSPEYSYWNGCSQGGRQGLMLAQRYPTAYDGISAGAPAIHWTELFSHIQWPQQVMNEMKQYPFGCELDAITVAAISACDELDGISDGVIARNDECLAQFDPFSLVGNHVQCPQTNNGTEIQVSEAAAIVANATWHGLTSAHGKQLYHGLAPGADLTGGISGREAIAATNCTGNVCVGAPSSLGSLWFQLFVLKRPGASLSDFTRSEYDDLLRQSSQQYRSMIGTDDADLTNFRDNGGKMVTFHGLSDNTIPPGATKEYYNGVARILPDVHSFYRHFEVPGLEHCFGGSSGQPNHLFRQLQEWVEHGTAPNRTPVKLNVANGEVHNRILCPYPEEAQFDRTCGDAASIECWSCGMRPTL